MSAGLSIALVQIAACDLMGARLATLTGPSKTAPACRARRRAVWLVREITGAGWGEIGEHFGGRDQSTVWAGYRRVEAERAADSEVDAELNALADAIRGRVDAGAGTAASTEPLLTRVAALQEGIVAFQAASLTVLRRLDDVAAEMARLDTPPGAVDRDFQARRAAA